MKGELNKDERDAFYNIFELEMVNIQKIYSIPRKMNTFRNQYHYYISFCEAYN